LVSEKLRSNLPLARRARVQAKKVLLVPASSKLAASLAGWW
jgi:hypothetical protein